MKHTTALLMALGLAFPAMAPAQDSEPARPPRAERPPLRDGRGDEANRGPRREAAEGERPAFNRDGPPARPPMVPPLMAALDANHDGVIDADEITNAPESLRKLDKNGDGKVTLEELRPARPDGNQAGAGGGAGVREDGRAGLAPRGNRDGAPGEGQRPARRNTRPPENQ